MSRFSSGWGYWQNHHPLPEIWDRDPSQSPACDWLITWILSSDWSVTGCRANAGSRNIMSRNRKKRKIATISMIARVVVSQFSLISDLPSQLVQSQVWVIPDIHHQTFEKVSNLPSRMLFLIPIRSHYLLDCNKIPSLSEERSSGSVLLLLFFVHSPESLLRVSDYIPERPLVLVPFWSQEDRNFWHWDRIFHRPLSTYTLYSRHRLWEIDWSKKNKSLSDIKFFF